MKCTSFHRSIGIDLLRLLAAFYVIVIHCVQQGGILAAAELRSHQFFACQALSALSFCAVNLFGLISGYVGYSEEEKPLNIKSYVLLWLEVVFYGFFIGLFFRLYSPGNVSNAGLIAMCFPLKNRLYWYFSAYSCVFFLTPVLNNGIRHCSRKTLLLTLGLLVLVFSPLETVSGCFYTNDGYSPLWLLILYLIGGIMRKYRLGQSLPTAGILAALVLCTGCSFLLGCVDPTALGLPFDAFSLPLSKYTFPLYVFSAMLYVILFQRLQLPTPVRKIVAFAAPGSFAVYLVNVQPHFWQFWMESRFRHWAGSSPVGLLGKVILFSLGFTAVVVTADHLRQRLFRCLPLQKQFSRQSR